MSDLTKSLRDWDDESAFNRGELPWPAKMMREAADEIERLAGLVETANKRFAEILDCVDDLRLVNRLKEIEKIAARAMLECQGHIGLGVPNPSIWCYHE